MPVTIFLGIVFSVCEFVKLILLFGIKFKANLEPSDRSLFNLAVIFFVFKPTLVVIVQVVDTFPTKFEMGPFLPIVLIINGLVSSSIETILMA